MRSELTFWVNLTIDASLLILLIWVIFGFNEKAQLAMRYIVLLFVVLVFWGWVDDYVVSNLQLSPNAPASDDDEYLQGQAGRTPQRLAKQEKVLLCAAALPNDGRLTFAEASLVLSCCNLQEFALNSRLYVLMSLQI